MVVVVLCGEAAKAMAKASAKKAMVKASAKVAVRVQEEVVVTW